MIYVDKNSFCHWFFREMLCLFHCYPPHGPFILSLTSPTYVDDSPAHQLMPQNFTMETIVLHDCITLVKKLYASRFKATFQVTPEELDYVVNFNRQDRIKSNERQHKNMVELLQCFHCHLRFLNT